MIELLVTAVAGTRRAGDCRRVRQPRPRCSARRRPRRSSHYFRTSRTHTTTRWSEWAVLTAETCTAAPAPDSSMGLSRWPGPCARQRPGRRPRLSARSARSARRRRAACAWRAGWRLAVNYRLIRASAAGALAIIGHLQSSRRPRYRSFPCWFPRRSLTCPP
jgi:hypothetical protein